MRFGQEGYQKNKNASRSHGDDKNAQVAIKLGEMHFVSGLLHDYSDVQREVSCSMARVAEYLCSIAFINIERRAGSVTIVVFI